MTHRAEQVVDAARSTLQAHALLAGIKDSIYKHRILSLSDQDQEMPAISVTLGEDAVLDEDGASNFTFFDSLQLLTFRIIVQGVAGDEEEHVITALQDLRRAIHVALMANDTLGLAFVISTRYGGADAPVLDGTGELLCGMLDCRWAVHYRMNQADPQ